MSNILENPLKNISYNAIKEKPAFVIPGKIGDLSKHDCGRALFKSISMFLSINKIYTDLLTRVVIKHKDGDESMKELMFELLDRDPKLLEIVIKNLKPI